ncbi:MAG: hypothetical protein II478_00460 [Bacteroidales bacterium]|nr:hypothetical protein [Bacteroidales bacterium]
MTTATTQSITLHPQVAALQAQLKELQEKSARLFAKAEYMQFEERPMLNSLYEASVGILLREEFKLLIQIKLTQLEINLTQAYINHNAPIDHRRISEQVKAAQQDYQAKIEQKEAELKKAEDFLNAPCLSQQETTELRDLYRTIAKALHPDLHPDQGREECDLFIKAASAYRVGDLQTLRQIALLIQANSPDALNCLPDQDLLTLIEKAKESIAIFQERIDLMNDQFPFIYRDKILDPQWIKEQQEELKERIKKAFARLKELQDYLMMLKLWNPDSSS